MPAKDSNPAPVRLGERNLRPPSEAEQHSMPPRPSPDLNVNVSPSTSTPSSPKASHTPPSGSHWTTTLPISNVDVHQWYNAARKGAFDMKSESGERYILQAEKEAESRAATQASQSWLRWLLRRGPELSSREKQDARDSVFFGKGLNDGVAGWLYGSFAVTGTAWLYAASNYIQQAQQARAGNSDPVTHAVTGFVLGLTGVAAMLSNSFLLKILEARFEEHIQRPLSKALAAPLAVDKMAWTAILFGNLVAMNPVFLFRDRTTLLPLVGEKFRISYYMGFIRDAAAFCKRSISESASPWGKDLTEAALGIRFRRYLIGDGLRRGFDPAQARHLLCKPAYSSHYWSAVSASVEGDLLPAAQPPVHFTSIRDRFAVRRMQSDEEWSDRLISEASLPGDGGLLRPQ